MGDKMSGFFSHLPFSWCLDRTGRGEGNPCGEGKGGNPGGNGMVLQVVAVEN